jgi:hypothetical protein
MKIEKLKNDVQLTSDQTDFIDFVEQNMGGVNAATTGAGKT